MVIAASVVVAAPAVAAVVAGWDIRAWLGNKAHDEEASSGPTPVS